MIRLAHVNKRYGDLQAVDDISLEIPSNTIFGIIGKSGAGKSTLVRLISLLERADSGEIYYGDTRVDTLSGKALRDQHKKTGMIFQSFNLFASRTAAGNIAYPLELAKMPKRKKRLPKLKKKLQSSRKKLPKPKRKPIRQKRRPAKPKRKPIRQKRRPIPL